MGPPKQRAVLAVLLLDLGRAVPADRLIDRVWGENPPGSVRNVLYSYVAKLRAALARTGDPGVTLTRQRGGYLLAANPDQLDLCQFRRLAAEAAAAKDEQAAALLRSALELWRGPALAGLDSPWLQGRRDALEMQRIAAVLDLGDIALRQGQHSALAGQLAEEAVAYPADERLIGQLMLALYRSGRQAEALHRFEQTRRRLAQELGADPGPDLQALHQRILLSDPSLAAPAPASPGTAPTDHKGDPANNGRAAPREPLADVTAPTGPGNQASTDFQQAGHPARRRTLTRWQLTAILLALAAVAGVSIAIVGLKPGQAPISEQIAALDQQLVGGAGPAHRIMIMQRLMAIAGSHPGTQSVSNRVLFDLNNFAVARSKRPWSARRPPQDLLYALKAIGGAVNNAFVNTPNMIKYLDNANFAGLNLTRLQFNVAILANDDLRGTNLHHAGLIAADLNHAQLQGADLTNANLNHANLSGAQLQDANLTGANLTGANLAGADFTGANLSGAALPCKTLRQAKNVPKAAMAHCPA